METVWLVDSCLPPDGIPQVAEPPLRYLPSFIGGAWRGIGAEREELDLVEWLELSEAQFRRYPESWMQDLDISSGCVVYRQIYTNFYIVNFTSRQFQPYTIILIRKNSFQRYYIYIKLKRLNIPLYTTRRGIFYSRIITNLPERERERKRLATRKINKSGKRV